MSVNLVICYLLLSEYVLKKNRCKKCPYGSTGTHPNCKCNDDGGIFNGEYCLYCPRNSIGIYGECVCHENKKYLILHVNCTSKQKNKFGKIYTILVLLHF